MAFFIFFLPVDIRGGSTRKRTSESETFGFMWVTMSVGVNFKCVQRESRFTGTRITVTENHSFMCTSGTASTSASNVKDRGAICTWSNKFMNSEDHLLL